MGSRPGKKRIEANCETCDDDTLSHHQLLSGPENKPTPRASRILEPRERWVRSDSETGPASARPFNCGCHARGSSVELIVPAVPVVRRVRVENQGSRREASDARVPRKWVTKPNRYRRKSNAPGVWNQLPGVLEGQTNPMVLKQSNAVALILDWPSWPRSLLPMCAGERCSSSGRDREAAAGADGDCRESDDQGQGQE